MLTILAVIIRIISNSLSNVFQKSLTKNGMNSYAVNFYTYAGLSIISLLFIKNCAQLTGITLFNAAAGGIFGAVGNYYLIKALSRGELSVLGPINAYKSLIAMIFAIFLAEEIPSFAGFSGILLLIFGSYVIFNTTEEGFSLKLFKRKDIQYRIYALVFTAIEAVFIKNVITSSDILTSFILWSLFGAFFAFILVLFNQIRLNKSSKANLRCLRPAHTGRAQLRCDSKIPLMFLIAEIFRTPDRFSLLILCAIITSTGIMQYSTNFVFERMNVSYALALFQLSAIINVFLGWKIFKEKDLLKKLFGSCIMVIGAAILIIF